MTSGPYRYTPEQRAEMLKKMHGLSDNFYRAATSVGCHAMVEFTGLMNEFIDVCEEAHARGQDFPFANTHKAMALPFDPTHIEYLAEKLGCIYGPSLLGSEECREAFVHKMFGGKYKLVPVDDTSRPK